jgi:hypothetical protein
MVARRRRERPVQTDEELLSNLPEDPFGLEWAQQRHLQHLADVSEQDYPLLNGNRNMIPLPGFGAIRADTPKLETGDDEDVGIEEYPEGMQGNPVVIEDNEDEGSVPDLTASSSSLPALQPQSEQVTHIMETEENPDMDMADDNADTVQGLATVQEDIESVQENPEAVQEDSEAVHEGAESVHHGGLSVPPVSGPVSGGSDSPLPDPPSDLENPREFDDGPHKDVEMVDEDEESSDEDDQTQEVNRDPGFSDAVSTLPVPFGPKVHKATDEQRQRYIENLRKNWNKKTGGEDAGREIGIPSGYSYIRIERDDKKTKDEDLYLYGHPSHYRFRSVNEFFPHLEFLIRKAKGEDANPCECKGCQALRKR